MQNTYNTTNDHLINKISRISWPAIFAGALTAITVSFMLNILGLGIGLSSIDPMSDQNTLEGLGTGTLIWWGLSNLAALFVGGLIAGRMSGLPSNKDGGLHGFLSWALYTMFSLWLLTSAVGGILSGVSSTFSSILGGSDAKDMAKQMTKAQETSENNATTSFKDIKDEAFNLLNKAEGYGIVSDDASSEVKETVNDVENDSKRLTDNLDKKSISKFFNELNFDIDNSGDLKISVEGNKDFIDKEGIKSYLTENTELSDKEIDNTVNKWEEKINTAVDKAEKYYAEAKQKAAKYAEKAAEVTSTISIIAFFIFLLGALAAFFGGTAGSPELTIDEQQTREKL